MRFFGREPLHRRLAREAGLLDDDREDLRPSWDKVGIHGVARPREWDAVVTVAAPAVRGDEVEFVALPDGALVVESAAADADLTPLADAVDLEVEPPYRAQGVRRDAEIWAVAARKIDVATFEADGEDLELTHHGDERTLLVDGFATFGTIPALERLGEQKGGSYTVRATRLEGDLWEIRSDAL